MSDEPSTKNDNFLAAELDGDQIKFAIPSDLLTAKHLLVELTHQVALAEIRQAQVIRAQMAHAQQAKAAHNGISVVGGDVLRRLKGLGN